MKVFPIDFIRQIIEQTLDEEHQKYPKKYFGGKNQVNLFSFYEQLQKDDEVDRFVKCYRDLTNQENRTGLIMNGVIGAPENPTITNLNLSDIIPLVFTCSFRVKLKDRDMALETMYHIIELLKGRKVDIAEFESGELFKVGTIGNNVLGNITIKSGDYVGGYTSASGSSFYDCLSHWHERSIDFSGAVGDYLYAEYNVVGQTKSTLRTFVCTSTTGTVYGGTFEYMVRNNDYQFVLYSPTGYIENKYQVSISFDSIRCDEPRTLNSEEYCVISMGGSATIVNSDLRLGNELTKLSIKRYLIKAQTDIDLSSSTKYWLEPLEMPSGNSANTQLNQIFNTNKFIPTTHSDSTSPTLQYTFILDRNIDIINEFFKYARYGIQGITGGSTPDYTNAITPNMIFEITEYWSCWGNMDIFSYHAKVIESIDIENTESDVLSITIPFQLQEAGE